MRWSLFLMTMLVVGCTISKKAEKTDASSIPDVVPVFEPGPHVMVYRTKTDLRENVPVLLTADGKDIVSYPHPSDLSVDGKLKLPTPLKNGYLMDNRGINQYLGFLKLTYSEYDKLEEAPSLAELNEMIIDREPLIEICDCGLRSAFTDIENQLNQLIEKDRLKSVCKVVN